MFRYRLLLASLLSAQLLAAPALAIKGGGTGVYKNESDFGLNWQARPLVDPNKPAIVPGTPQPGQAAPEAPRQPDVEAALKPMIPFVSAIEKRLQLTPPPAASTQSRLTQIQMVVFGEPLYHDAGELFNKLGELFPQDAEKAHLDALAEMQKSPFQTKGFSMKKVMDHPAIRLAPGSTYFPGLANQMQNTPKAKEPAFAPLWPATPTPMPNLMPGNSMSSPPASLRQSDDRQAQSLTQTLPQDNGIQAANNPPKQKLSKRFHFLKHDDPFDDPFFKDDGFGTGSDFSTFHGSVFSQGSATNNTSNNSPDAGAYTNSNAAAAQSPGFQNQGPQSPGVQNQGDGLRAAGRGLATLAMIAAPIAGSYFLGKSSLGGKILGNRANAFSSSPYGYGGYGYGTGYYPNAYPYGAPYGYGNPYAYGYGGAYPLYGSQMAGPAVLGNQVYSSMPYGMNKTIPGFGFNPYATTSTQVWGMPTAGQTILPYGNNGYGASSTSTWLGY